MTENRAVKDIVIPRDRHRVLKNLEKLAKSIADIGLLHPIVIRSDNILIVGQRRLEAFKILERETIPVTIADDIDTLEKALRAECDENTCREDFTPEEAVAKAAEIEAVTQEMARKAQTEAGKEHGGDRKSEGAKIGLGQIALSRSNITELPRPKQDESARATAMAAAAVGWGRKTYEKAKEVVASGDPKLIEKMNRSGKVNAAYKALRTQLAAEKIRTEPPVLPAGPYRVIVIDPPWDYSNRKDDLEHRAANPYPSMSIEEIKAFPLPGLAHDDCILWLWTTNAFLPVAWDIISTWGFTYKTMLTWVKDKIGTGDWLRGQTEHCLMCIKGRPVIELTNQSTVIHGPLRKHSEKPDEFYEMIDKLCPGSKLDIFGRKERSSWDVYGNEVDE